MANVKIMANAFVLTSAIKMEDLKKIEKFHPEYLVKLDPETKDEVFKISTGTSGDIKSFGVKFDNKNAEGCANVTKLFPDSVGAETEARQKYITDTVGKALLNLNAFELEVSEKLTNLNAELAAIAGNITVVD